MNENRFFSQQRFCDCPIPDIQKRIHFPKRLINGKLEEFKVEYSYCNKCQKAPQH